MILCLVLRNGLAASFFFLLGNSLLGSLVFTRYWEPSKKKVFFSRLRNLVKKIFFLLGYYVSTLPTCGPLLILPPALKRWGLPRRQGLCSHLAHLWATTDSAPRSEAVGTPQAAGVM